MNSMPDAEPPHYSNSLDWHLIQHRHRQYNLFKSDDIELRCIICKQQFSTILTLQRHMNSQKHAMKMENCSRTKRTYKKKYSNTCVKQSVADDIKHLDEMFARQNARYVLDDLKECFNDKEHSFINIEPSMLPDILQAVANEEKYVAVNYIVKG